LIKVFSQKYWAELYTSRQFFTANNSMFNPVTKDQDNLTQKPFFAPNSILVMLLPNTPHYLLMHIHVLVVQRLQIMYQIIIHKAYFHWAARSCKK